MTLGSGRFVDGPDAPGSPWSARHSWTLAALVLAGLLWRLHVALGAPWYWDEGYVVEWARSLAVDPLARAHVGGLWEDGFFPLSTSFFAPLSAAPFTLLPWCSAMAGVRLWAVSLDMLTLGLLAFLARPKENPRLALLVAAAYALLPFAAEFGGRAFYHHFAVALMLACLALGRGLFGRENTARVIPSSLCAGLGFASCYWLWWLPLSWCLLLCWKRPKGWAWGLFWTALPPLAVLAVSFLPDPQGAWWSVQGMLKTSGNGGLNGCAAWWRALQVNFAALPFLGVGLLGLALAALRARGPWPWFLACLACAIEEPLRQRGASVGIVSSYPFQIAAPLAALGAAALADRLLEAQKSVGVWAAGAALLVFFLPVNLGWLDHLSFEPAPVRDLAAFFGKNARPGDLVCGVPPLDWALGPRLRVCIPNDVAAAEGRPTTFYPASAPASRFAYPCGVGSVRYAVTSTVHLYFIFPSENLSLAFLEMERAGWPVVFSSPSFRVYENPRFGVKPDPGVRILQTAADYEIAYAQALAAKRPDLMDLAAERLRALGSPLRTPGTAP